MLLLMWYQLSPVLFLCLSLETRGTVGRFSRNVKDPELAVSEEVRVKESRILTPSRVILPPLAPHFIYFNPADTVSLSPLSPPAETPGKRREQPAQARVLLQSWLSPRWRARERRSACLLSRASVSVSPPYRSVSMTRPHTLTPTSHQSSRPTVLRWDFSSIMWSPPWS